jgi:hypothetical protein
MEKLSNNAKFELRLMAKNARSSVQERRSFSVEEKEKTGLQISARRQELINDSENWDNTLMGQKIAALKELIEYFNYLAEVERNLNEVITFKS